VEVNLQGNGEEVKDLPEPQAITLFHICQEALANVAKHAHAHKVNLSLWTSVDRALLEVADDGRGFTIESVKLTLGHGLANMQTRAHNSGGDVEITAEPGTGTTVLAWVPFTRKKINP
jgi:signal transduction histidine kinase